MLSEISQGKTNAIWSHWFVESKELNKQTKQEKQTSMLFQDQRAVTFRTSMGQSVTAAGEGLQET